MAKKRRIGILTGGGDVPGLNVAIKSVVERAQDHDIEVIGLRRGWWGTVGINPDNPQTLEELTMPLTLRLYGLLNVLAVPACILLAQTHQI